MSRRLNKTIRDEIIFKARELITKNIHATHQLGIEAGEMRKQLADMLESRLRELHDQQELKTLLLLGKKYHVNDWNLPKNPGRIRIYANSTIQPEANVIGVWHLDLSDREVIIPANPMKGQWFSSEEASKLARLLVKMDEDLAGIINEQTWAVAQVVESAYTVEAVIKALPGLESICNAAAPDIPVLAKAKSPCSKREMAGDEIVALARDALAPAEELKEAANG